MSPDSPAALVIGANYPPEQTGNAPYTGALASGLTSRGAHLHVLTTHPHYPAWRIRAGYGQWSKRERVAGVRVTRLRHFVPRRPTGLLRVVSEISFGLRAVGTRWGNPRVILGVSPALLATWIALQKARVTHRHTPFVVWVQDLYSLGLSETGQGGGLVWRLMKSVEGEVLRRSAGVIVIHDRFARKVTEDFGVPSERIRVVRNWTHLAPAPKADVAATRRTHGWHDGELIVLHAGNMGIKQGLENVVEAARIADSRNAPVRFVLLGAGGQRESLKKLAEGLQRIQFIDPLADDDFIAALQAADVLLVNERPGVAEMAVPSKLTSYFDAGRPVLAATNLSGITAEEIEASRAGIVVPAGSPEALLDAAIRLGDDTDLAHELGANGMRYRRTVLDEETALDKFAQILESLVADRSDAGQQHR